MHIETLTQLQYSTDRKGPFALYVYDANGYHRGPQWFRDKPKYPDEEITTAQAHNRAFAANAKQLEVRVTDPGDMLVFHCKDGKVLYGENFWHEVGDSPGQSPAK